ncbi:BglG family transcription antiterminator LicT [Enterococcus rivorum]|uniref:Transcription antiterminator BglG n=1 Tax=Enterococcus rivorum TaxID=762845 RepID=A0A1E5KTL8_9ENTE|nr:PRD domain-containing protein [Enterococcus rivorum]MBP2097912.1 beta-glucoside operon transcriptional antiterminator [Enterococcus rivorum]OEH81235.1 transcription antiterminator BglG [Enterococcus rivorum]
MNIEKILNNNVVLSKNEAGEEIVCMGRGLAFQKKIGDTIDLAFVEKEFVLKDSATAGHFQQLFSDIPADEVDLVKKIVDMAETELGTELSSNIYLTLTDHVHYAIIRAKEGLEMPNPLMFETKKFYPKEFAIAKRAVSLIEEKVGVVFAESEAGFIAFHIVNSEQANGNMEVTMSATEMVRDILTIISRYFGQPFDEESLNYQRIVTHLQYFAQRYLQNEIHDDEDEFLYELIQSKYPKAFQAVQRINDFLLKTYQKPIDEAEQIYLTIHIQRVVAGKKS